MRPSVIQTNCRVCMSVTLVNPAKTAEPTEMPFRLRTRVDQRNRVLDGGPDFRTGRSNFKGKRGRPVVKYSHTLPWAVQKRLNRWRCRLGFGLGWAQGSLRQLGVHTGATWRIPLNRPCAVAMRPYVKLLWPLDTHLNNYYTAIQLPFSYTYGAHYCKSSFLNVAFCIIENSINTKEKN